MNQEYYRKLVSGQSRGFVAVLLRFMLGIAAIGYSLAVRLRTLLYSAGWLKTHRANAVVLSIGNITVGGTGKTPLVIWLCKLLRQRNVDCAILTRGYKTRRASCVMRRAKNARNTQYDIRGTIDEPAILAKSCPEAQVIVNPDRVAGAAEAADKFGAAALIMDDGFQHRRLARDLDIVAVDATQPFGYGKLLPAGLLREPLCALRRADAVVITRCDQIAELDLQELGRKLRQLNPNAAIAESIHAPVSAKTIEHGGISPDELRGKRIFAFCGIGNPQAFLTTLRELGTNVVGWKVYDDHTHYSAEDIASICEQGRCLKADLILTTQKDWTKIALLDAFKDDIAFAYLVIQIEFLAGEDQLTDLIENALGGKIARK